MTDCGKNILLPREGSDQNSRFIHALNPDSFELNSLSLEEWMEFAYNFAGHLNFFDTQNDSVPNGNWQTFFKSKSEIQEFLNSVEKGGDVSPHLALFVAFVKLLEITQKRFNALTRRHLDFYYAKVLQLQKHAAAPDSVHVLLNLAKNAVAEKIEQGAALNAEKDDIGEPLVYKTAEELVANQAKVAQLKSFYYDTENQKLKAAAVANSFDGKGADFPNDEIKWWPFAYYELAPETGESDLREYPELDDAPLGFAVAGEILNLQEGERTVAVALEFEQELSNRYTPETISESVEIYCTGEKGWLGPLEIIESMESAKFSFATGSDDSNAHKLTILFRIPKYEGAVVAYQSEIHGERFNTPFPLCRVLLKTGSPDHQNLYRDCVAKTLAEMTIHVNVSGVEQLTLFNDVGGLNADKPFYPFGTQPVKKSKFYIDYPELRNKKWNSQRLTIEWKNTPGSFKNWYYAYRKNENAMFSSLEYVQGIYLKDIQNEVEKAQTLEENIQDFQDSGNNIDTAFLTTTYKQINFQPNNLIVDDDDYFTAAVEIKQAEVWNLASHQAQKALFESSVDGIFYTEITVENPGTDQLNVGPLRLSLNQSFLHEMFPRLYALAISSENKSVIVPNEPYTPFVEKVVLDYSASATLKPDKTKYAVNDFQLFHEHPFGQAIECILEKSANPVIAAQEAQKLYALPAYSQGGELYIGFENAVPKQNISLLIQVLEGSENPEAESFVDGEKVEWWMLCNNAWKQLDRSSVIVNKTDNLLKSGIVKFTVPADATTNNTVLPPGFIWLKARIHKTYNAVSKVLGIHAQAVLAQFDDNGNSHTHLAEGLPAETISKMQTRPARVKSLSQPYSSFGGKPEEDDTAYYRRISERLRHKNRAVTLWDYEHLVLQQFPEVHKIKCLNHTAVEMVNGRQKTNYLAPGNLVLVVVPDIVNRNVFDIYKPRLSQALLNEMQTYLEKLNAPLVKSTVINPLYEEVRVDLKVRFYSGFDEGYYKTVLNKDITRLLSPWAFDNQAAIRFGVSLHKSVIIDFVEKLNYVDFISDVKLFQKNTVSAEESNVAVAVPSCPEAILVSAKAHTINDIQTTCPTNNQNNHVSIK